MIFEYYLLIILAFLPLLYKYSFWFYVIQLKEYRWDRFREYLRTKQGKKALFDFWILIEIPLLLLNFVIFFDFVFERIIYPMVFYFLVIFNIFVLGKIFRGVLLKPKITIRLLIIILFLIIGYIIDIYFYTIIFDNYYYNIIYSYILFSLIFAPFYIFIGILFSLPLVNYFKNKKINNAILKSNNINNFIKIGITGSFGKSSIKEYLYSILKQDGKTIKTPENINTELGVSAIILNKLNNKYKYFIAEMGAYKIGEIDILGKIVNHKYGFLTGVGNQHIGLFGSQQNISIGKSEIQNSILKNNGILYINWNNENIRKIKFIEKLNIIKYGNYKLADAKFNIIHIQNGITKFEFNYKKYKNKFEINLLGEHNILNITGIIAFLYDLGIKTIQIKKYLKNIKGPKSTLSILKKSGNILIDDSYNLSQNGLEVGLGILKHFKGEKILVLDDILELGTIAPRIHLELGKKIAKMKLIKKILFCGINYREEFINGLIKGGFNQKNIINNLDKTYEKSIILFEGRGSKQYFDKLK